jgi:hypothetical protein
MDTGPFSAEHSGAMITADSGDAAPVSRPDGTQVWAVCCSGGGIRSASYCLGALQRLEAANFLGKAEMVLGVSGGSYIAASRALVAHGLGGTGDGGDQRPPYAPGSPEEEHLRDNTRYLAPDAKTMLAGVLTLLFGVAVTLLLVLTPLFAVAHAWGWVLRSHGVLVPPVAARASQWTLSLTATSWWIWPVIAAGVTFLIFLWWWATLVPSPGGKEGHSNVAVKALGWAAFVTLVLATAMLVVPAVVYWLSSPHSGNLKTVLDNLGFGSGASWTPAAIAGFVAAVVAVSQSAAKFLTKYNVLSAPAAAQAANAQSGILGTVTGYLRGLLLPWLASILVVLAGFIAGLRWAKDGAAAGFTRDQIWQVIVALAIMLVTRALADANRISLHDFYRWRLATAYAVERDTGAHGDNPAPFGIKNRPGALLTELSGDQPKLVMCATANMNAQREVPVGRGGLSFSFDPEYATLRGPDPCDLAQARTADYEALVGRRRATLYDISAISGAAFSPLMGSATLEAYRILFTATDLRLGVWLPHPAVVAAAKEELDSQGKQGKPPDRWWHALGLYLWYLLPHPFWKHGGEKPRQREARLWAYLLRLRRDGTGHRGFLGGVLYHALQPTLGMLYAEAAGHTSYRSTWMCVTDGGHYDNLGLVEAIQRGATHILVLDASGDKPHTWFTLGGAIALARSDAGAEIELQPRKMIIAADGSLPTLEAGEVVSPWVAGSFTRQGPRAAAGTGAIVVCKLGWFAAAPWDVCAYAAGHPTYPSESTFEQLYDGAEFDAYRELGACSVDLAIGAGALSALAVPAPR